MNKGNIQKELETKIGTYCPKLNRFISIDGNCTRIDSFGNEITENSKICEYFKGMNLRIDGQIKLVVCNYKK